MRHKIIGATFAAAIIAAGGAAQADAAISLCVPKTAGQAAFSGGDNPSVYCNGAQTVLMPDSTADQQKIIDLLPYISYKKAGIGGAPTLVFTGLNVQIKRKDVLGVPPQDGTANLIVGNGVNYSNPSATATFKGYENIVVGSDNEWQGNNNIVVGSFHRVSGSANLIGGRQAIVSGAFNFHSGKGHTIAGNHNGVLGGGWNTFKGSSQAILGGSSRSTSTAEHEVLGDGTGTDVHWARYDTTGKVVASSEPVEYQYLYPAPNGYSLTKWKGVDVTKCSVSAGTESARWVPTAQSYYGYAYARWSSLDSASSTAFPAHTVTAVCGRQPGAVG